MSPLLLVLFGHRLYDWLGFVDVKTDEIKIKSPTDLKAFLQVVRRIMRDAKGVQRKHSHDLTDDEPSSSGDDHDNSDFDDEDIVATLGRIKDVLTMCVRP